MRVIGLNLCFLSGTQTWDAPVALRQAVASSRNPATWHGYCLNNITVKETALGRDAAFFGMGDQMHTAMTGANKGTRIKRGILCLPILSALGLILTMPLSAEIGVKGGMSLSGLQSATGDYRHVLGYELDGLSGGRVLKGFQAGLFRTFDLSRRFQVQPEISFALRGGNGGTTYLYDDIVFKVNISYVEVPLILKYKIVAGRTFSSAVCAGPYAALKLKAEKRTRIWKEEETTPLPNVRSFDYGVILGLTVEHAFGSGRALLDLRSGVGLNDIMDVLPETIPLYPDKDHIRNLYVSVLVGYAFS